MRQRAGLALATLHRPRVLFLDEPTAGVDVHNRALFWEIIQDEAQAGTTVFVTTHFLEEADYCDWVSFIHRGRLIADAPPEELRRRFSDGYRVDVAVDAAQRGRAAERLTGVGTIETTPEGLRWRLPGLDPDALRRLNQLSDELPDARFVIEQPQMTDVVRRLLSSAEGKA